MPARGPCADWTADVVFAAPRSALPSLSASLQTCSLLSCSLLTCSASEHADRRDNGAPHRRSSTWTIPLLRCIRPTRWWLASTWLPSTRGTPSTNGCMTTSVVVRTPSCRCCAISGAPLSCRPLLTGRCSYEADRRDPPARQTPTDRGVGAARRTHPMGFGCVDCRERVGQSAGCGAAGGQTVGG